MGAERYLAKALKLEVEESLAIRDYVVDKDILVIPGYGNSAFLFAKAGALSVTVYDKDPVTIAWVKAMKKYYHYREYSKEGRAYVSVGELLNALTCWYPPLITLPSGRFGHSLLWIVHPQALRRRYLFYLLSLLKQAVKTKTETDYELAKPVQFHVGEVDDLPRGKAAKPFDTVFVPYLLGVKNGIESREQVVDFIKKIAKLAPGGHLLVSPSHQAKEFHVGGPSYFVTTGDKHLGTMPGLERCVVKEDSTWFRNQGLTVFTLMR
jgi:hypothetical protein